MKRINHDDDDDDGPVIFPAIRWTVVNPPPHVPRPVSAHYFILSTRL